MQPPNQGWNPAPTNNTCLSDAYCSNFNYEWFSNLGHDSWHNLVYFVNWRSIFWRYLLFILSSISIHWSHSISCRQWGVQKNRCRQWRGNSRINPELASIGGNSCINRRFLSFRCCYYVRYLTCFKKNFYC